MSCPSYDDHLNLPGEPGETARCYCGISAVSRGSCRLTCPITKEKPTVSFYSKQEHLIVVNGCDSRWKWERVAILLGLGFRCPSGRCLGRHRALFQDDR